MFIPGEEELDDVELRVTVLGSGNPWVTRAQALGSILVEVGNPECDLLVFDLDGGSLANDASLKLPVNLLDKVCFTHLKGTNDGRKHAKCQTPSQTCPLHPHPGLAAPL